MWMRLPAACLVMFMGQPVSHRPDVHSVETLDTGGDGPQPVGRAPDAVSTRSITFEGARAHGFVERTRARAEGTARRWVELKGREEVRPMLA